MNRISLFLLSTFICFQLMAQDELLALLDDQEGDEYVSATFKSTRLINGHTVEIRSHKVLEAVISHRFGEPRGINNFYGLDNANVRLALEYGLAKNLNIGLGRSSFSQDVDTYAKYRLFRQSKKTPVTLTAFGSMAFVSAPYLDFVERKHRFKYTGQLLIARKFSSSFSMQLMPTLVQRNLVPTNDDDNGLIALGVGGRLKITNRTSFNVEWYPQLSDYNDQRYNSFAVGFDIETGGHVFQLHLTNAQQMIEAGFIGETSDDFIQDGLHFGFNISRVFDLGRNKKNWDSE